MTQRFMQGKERTKIWSVTDYAKHIIMLLVKIPMWILQLCCFWLPVKKNRVIIYSLTQHGYSCNLKYLTEYLLKEAQTDYEILWIVGNRENYELLQARGIPVAMLRSKEHIAFRLRAGIVVSSDEFYPMFYKTRKQLYVNTWHGAINYKKIGYAGLDFSNPIQKLIYIMNNPCPDIFMSGSRSFTETTSSSFGFQRDVFLECGLPRNDILCRKKDDEKIVDIKRRLGIPPQKRVLLYAPTFRKGGYGPQQKMDYRAVCTSLSQRFGGEWVVLLRQHYFVKSDSVGIEGFVWDVSQYEDMQELILCSDCMISDYSSCMWDFILTGNPCFAFVPDLESYGSDDRSFFIPVDRWPYPFSANTQQLCKQIEQFDAADFAHRTRQHLLQFGSFDKGKACETLVEIFEKHQNERKEKHL